MTLLAELDVAPSTRLHPLAHRPALERAAGNARRGQRTAARLALCAYLVARLVDRAIDGTATRYPQEAERQRRATKRRVSTLPDRNPERVHLLAIIDAVRFVAQDHVTLRNRLNEYAEYLEATGRLEEALDLLSAVPRVHPHVSPMSDTAAQALFAGRLNRLLAQWEAAEACYRAAEDGGRQAGDEVLMLRGRLGQGAVQRGRGNLPAARALAEAVSEYAAARGHRAVEAMAHADLAAVLRQQGLLGQALANSYRAFELFEDPTQRLRALGDVGIGLLELGAFDVARLAFELVAVSGSKSAVRINALVELIDLESAVGDRTAFERRRAEAASLRTRMPPSTAVDFHYRTGIGLTRFGQADRGRRALVTALRLAERHRLHAWYFRVEQAIAGLATANARAIPGTTKPGTAALVVHELERGLREYAVRA